jgi:hypothetical protein
MQPIHERGGSKYFFYMYDKTVVAEGCQDPQYQKEMVLFHGSVTSSYRTATTVAGKLSGPIC